jgi:hypothetical protein
MRITFDFDDKEALNRFLDDLVNNGLGKLSGGKPTVDGAKITIKRTRAKSSQKDIQSSNSVLFGPVGDVGIVDNTSIYLANNKIVSTSESAQNRPLSDGTSRSKVSTVRDCWQEHYSNRYGFNKRHPWGAREGGQAKNLLASMPLEDILELIPQYFRWPNAQVIRAGHPFGIGPNCFVLKHLELRADLVAPERHAEAAEAEAQMRDATQEVSRASIVEAAMRDHERKTKKLES